MARIYEQVLEELTEAREEFTLIEAMSEDEACYTYNTDSKAELVKVLNEEIEALEKEVEYLTPVVYESEYNY